MSVRILLGDVRAKLAELPDESVHCVVTSPPYFGLRDYGVAGQIGLEPTPPEFVAVMVDVFREVRRVLRRDGTLWLNLGDSYSAGGNGGGGEDAKQRTNAGSLVPPNRTEGFKPKNLLGIPWRVAFALQADGWYLRQDIIWAKPNPMPESVTDRCTKAHEYLFLLSKSARYHYDAEAIREEGEGYGRGTDPKGKMYSRLGVDAEHAAGSKGHTGEGGRNKRSVWEVATYAFSAAHFATFPPDLIEPCIKAGCPKNCCAKCGAPVVRDVESGDAPERATGAVYTANAYKTPQSAPRGPKSDFGLGKPASSGWSLSCSCDAGVVRGTVLDPFGGAGTTGLVADRLQRDAILIELNPEYAQIARDRIKGDGSLFAEVA